MGDDPAPPDPPDRVTNAVPDDRRQHDDESQGPDIDFPQARRDAPEDRDGLSGHDEADEEGVLNEDDDPDDRVDQPAGLVEDLLSTVSMVVTIVRHTPEVSLSRRGLGPADYRYVGPRGLAKRAESGSRRSSVAGRPAQAPGTMDLTGGGAVAEPGGMWN